MKSLFVLISQTLFLVVLLLVAVSSLVFCFIVQPNANQQNFTATVDRTYIERGYTFFVVIDENGKQAVLSNKVNLWKGKFGTNDVLMNLDIGKTYRFETIGYPLPWYSIFPNIIEYQELK